MGQCKSNEVRLNTRNNEVTLIDAASYPPIRAQQKCSLTKSICIAVASVSTDIIPFPFFALQISKFNNLSVHQRIRVETVNCQTHQKRSENVATEVSCQWRITFNCQMVFYGDNEQSHDVTLTVHNSTDTYVCAREKKH